MPADIAKSTLGYLAEFHCHTQASDDAFTSESELLRACLKKGIGLLTITEHDRLPSVDTSRFAAHGIQIIPGCEFTCSRGSHIIGLFIREGLEKGAGAAQIFAHIRDQGGVVLIPHPFKSGSGFCALHTDHERFLPSASLIEVYNGGLDHDEEACGRIRALAGRFNLRLVAASDAHKPDQVGYYVTAYPQLALNNDVRATLLGSQGNLLVDSSRLRKPRSLNAVQERRGYQTFVTRLPAGAKCVLKKCLYRLRKRGRVVTAPRYVQAGQ